MYLLSDKNFFVGTDINNHPIIVSEKNKAMLFKTEQAARNYLTRLPDVLKINAWHIYNVAEIDDCNDCDDADVCDDCETPENADRVPEYYGHSNMPTPFEEEGFDISDFFTDVINKMSHIDKYIMNMESSEHYIDMKILDIRHYIRDNDHRLNAIQMQRLGFYLRELEKERYDCKSNRLIASMFANNINALKDIKCIQKIHSIRNSKYRPKILEDSDIEDIINKKKE